MSKEQHLYIKRIKMQKLWVTLIQLALSLLFIILWEFLARKGIINTFIFSSPSNIISTIKSLVINGNLFSHIFTTLYETLIAFILGITGGIGIAIILYCFPFIAKIVEPFLTLINSLPKVALGPIIIIWIGANTNSIIVMALLINLIISVLTIYNGFKETDKNKIKLLKSFSASKYQILTKCVIPSNYPTIISALKINISMSLIGVIMGEFLVSKKGLGYLIMYGSQVFNLNLVMSSIIILIIISFIMYKLVSIIKISQNKNAE